MKKKETKLSEKIDIRLLYILPSLLALVFALTTFGFLFGNELVDLRNTCYTVYFNTPDNMETEEIIKDLDDLLVGYDISGFTINLNTQGASIIDGEVDYDDSMQIEFMDISRDAAYDIAKLLKERYSTAVLIRESVVKVTLIGIDTE